MKSSNHGTTGYFRTARPQSHVCKIHPRRTSTPTGGKGKCKHTRTKMRGWREARCAEKKHGTHTCSGKTDREGLKQPRHERHARHATQGGNATAEKTCQSRECVWQPAAPSPRPVKTATRCLSMCTCPHSHVTGKHYSMCARKLRAHTCESASIKMDDRARIHTRIQERINEKGEKNKRDKPGMAAGPAVKDEQACQALLLLSSPVINQQGLLCSPLPFTLCLRHF